MALPNAPVGGVKLSLLLHNTTQKADEDEKFPEVDTVFVGRTTI